MEAIERIVALEVGHARLEERLKDQEEYRKKQNGSLQRIEENVAEMGKTINERMNKIYFWLIGLMGGVIASLILLLVNISLGR